MSKNEQKTPTRGSTEIKNEIKDEDIDPQLGEKTPPNLPPNLPPKHFFTPQNQIIEPYSQSAKVKHVGLAIDPLVEFKLALQKIKHEPLQSTFDKISHITSKPNTLVILSPLSYKHTFERYWESKKHIVERPERLKATCLGIAAALSLAIDKFHLIDSHRESSLDADHVTRIHGSWSACLSSICDSVSSKLARRELEIPSDWPEGDIYLAPETSKALRGVIGAIEIAIDHLYSLESQLDSLSLDDTHSESGFSSAFVAIRPPGHHSHSCEPSGFCLINNAHIAIQYAQKYGVTHAAILDFDLHHGDGSQDITWNLGKNGPSVGYFSLHDINSFPTEMGYASPEKIKNSSLCLMAHGKAIWNIHLEPYQTEADFWLRYESHYKELFNKANIFLKNAPSSLLVISAGFDASEFESIHMQRHGIHVPTEFYHRFSQDAISLAKKHSAKILSLLEGGYSNAALATGVMSHLTGLAGLDWNKEIASPKTVKEIEKVCSSKESKVAKGSLHEALRLGKLLWPPVKLSLSESARPRRTVMLHEK